MREVIVVRARIDATPPYESCGDCHYLLAAVDERDAEIRRLEEIVMLDLDPIRREVLRLTGGDDHGEKV